ncbi:hypothetical protein OB955_00565 [Halobacteria archaeon AArc-m2/3/4]|uniref:Uncharacterized protein n=1 Tax=Natronoglomus mannanivorans TaxID=2979990 RepID=A0AAP2YZ43_9EURY|nr:hypothetical protein [Halobacteria archaeon AArc-xg1-1]MCU4971230.1 hypothetical protein [Halobacteria archaeon AArc-m2/3/4]
MLPLSRRRVLRIAGLGIGTALAGCLDRSDPAGDTDDGNSDDDGIGDDTDDDNGTETELVAHDTIQFGVTGSRPGWFDAMGETVGDVTLIDTGERADAVWSNTDGDTDRRADVVDFLRDTSFEDSVLLSVESVGPNTCHDTIAFDDVALEDGRLTATASVVDSSGADEACGEAITYPSALLRATFSAEPVTEATVTVVDGWGNEETLTATADDSLSLAPAPDELPGYVKPDGDPEHVPTALECDDEGDGVDRLQNWVDEDDIEWGTVEDEDGTPLLALRVDERTVDPGETVEITMTNVSDERVYTGNRHKHSLEVYTDAGWQDVRVMTDDRLGYTDEGVGHEPGDGFRWSFELTEDGVVADHAHADFLEVCPGLPAGRYRFVFWETDVAVAFDLTE